MNVTHPLPQQLDALSRLDGGIDRAVRWLTRAQLDDGHWYGVLESNSCIEAEWILAMHVLGVEQDPKFEGVVQAIRNEQRPDGSWEVYHNAPEGDINATVECYAALRAAGVSADTEAMRRARSWILGHGGLPAVRVFTRFWLAVIGEWPWEATPSLPPEIILLPKWLPFNIYEFSSWARATIVPLAVLSARRPVWPLPRERRLDELFPEGRDRMDYRLPRRETGWFGRVLWAADRALNQYTGAALQPGREKAIRLCVEWVIRHQEADGGWGGIQPPLVYSLMALRCEGHALEDPVLARGLRAFDPPWAYQKDGGTYFQCSASPVWDTLLSLLALLDCGRTPETCPAVTPALEWILQRQVKVPGDWQIKTPCARPGGWAFEWHNNWYPDVDDTAVALLVLARLRPLLPAPSALDGAIERAERWVRSMQCANGGWAAFDRDNDSRWLTSIPFCDFGEVLDPPSVDVTAHVVEALAGLGYGPGDPAIGRALQYIRREQEPDGSWFGRWGVNHIYGTAAVLPALQAVGEDLSAPYVRRAVSWLVHRQNPDGGWGETCASYVDHALRGVGESTASQTGWALMALLAADRGEHDEAIRRGVDHLLDRQRDGTWDESHYTGTGFPGYGVGERTDLERARAALPQGQELSRGFMINYNMYRHYFPLLALGRARRRWNGARERSFPGWTGPLPGVPGPRPAAPA